MYPDCLKDLVGLVHTPTNCFTGSDISNVSTLDLFVTQDPAYDNCRFRADDTQCELYKLLAEMREEALKLITVDVGAMLSSRVKSRQDCHYFIGQNQYGSYLAPNLVPSNPSLEIKTVYQPGAFIRIDQIALMIYPIGGAITVPLTLRRKLEGGGFETVTTWDIQVNNMSNQPKPVLSAVIPCDGSTYIVEYTYNPTTMSVPLSQYHCGCGDKVKCARGFIEENVSTTYGISLYTTMFCQSGLAICSLLDDHTYRMVLAYMLRKLIIRLTLEKIYNRQEVNRFTLLSSEDTVAQIESYNLEYNNRLAWLGQQNNFDTDGFCLTCQGAGNGGRKFNMLSGR